MDKLKIIWSKKATKQLKYIFHYYKNEKQSPNAAKNIKNDILKASREIVFSEQYQKDDVQPEFRRIIVRNYKLLYEETDGNILILSIFDTRRNPKKQLGE